MKTNVKKMILLCLVICCMTCIFILTGCSNGTPNAEKIKSDLNASEFVNASDLYNGETRMIPVTAVYVDDIYKGENRCQINCDVIQEDENYIKETKLVLIYSNINGWVLDAYNSVNVSVMPISGVPDEVLTNYAASMYGGYGENPKCTVECVDITHEFEPSSLTDNTTVKCVVTSKTCIKTVLMEIVYMFDGKWVCDDRNDRLLSREWRYDEIEGTTWQGRVGTGARTLRINSIDAENQTINLNYGYTDLHWNEICEYNILEYEGRNGAERMFVMDLTYDFYNVEIHEDGIWYGTGLIEIND